MKTYTIFLSSSMSHKLRSEISKVAESVNETFKNLGVNASFEIKVYGKAKTPNDTEPNTQEKINDDAVKSDIFLLLVDNNKEIGNGTIDEYRKAKEQSEKDGLGIKVFVITSQEQESIKLEYKEGDGSYANFEQLLSKDSKRYMESICKEKFCDKFRSWLENHATRGNSYNQEQLSYATFLEDNGQGVRCSDNAYYRRHLDDKIDEILKTSPIVILEGNTYSGKTRAAFETMKSTEEWKDRKFHVFYPTHLNDSGSNSEFLEKLNSIRLNLTRKEQQDGDIFLLDDINAIMGNESCIINNNPGSLWHSIQFNKDQIITKENFGNNCIIITVSGKLSDDQKLNLYKRIFNVNEVGKEFQDYLNSIIVNFDIYDKISFIEMVDEMRRRGVLIGNIRKGNYTIGSLFIKEDDLKARIQNFYQQEIANRITQGNLFFLLKTIVGHYRYVRGEKVGNISELKKLYEFFGGGSFDRDVEQLRKEGLLVKKSSDFVLIDEFVLKIMNEIVLEGDNAIELNKLLVEYAESDRNENKYVSSYSHMGYLLCDHNNLTDNEIDSLISYIKDKILPEDRREENIGATDRLRIYRLLVIISNKKEYNKKEYDLIFCATAVARLQNFDDAKRILDELNNRLKLESAKNLYKRIIFSMFSKNNRILTMAEEQTLLSYMFKEDKSWKEPFGDDDLKDIFNFHRISPFLELDGKGFMNRIITSLKFYVDTQINVDTQISEDEMDDIYLEFKDKDAEDDMSEDVIDNNIIISRFGRVIITAISLVNSFDEFNQLKERIEKEVKIYINLKLAVERIVNSFYWNVPNIAKRLTYEDRKQFFDFIFGIEEAETEIFGNEKLANKNYTRKRIMALNQLLELLDEKDALDSCEQMLNSKVLYDDRTLSHLFKNNFLHFEQLLPLIDRQANFITYNQLLYRAETDTDAKTCLVKMGIEDANPAKLRDERALASYLSIKNINRKECIKILKDWHQLHPKSSLSDVCLGSYIGKLSVEDLLNILEKDHDICKQEYGLELSEIESMRKNAVFYNILIYKANNSENYKEIVKCLFNKLKGDQELMKLIVDPNYNKNNSIFSVYIKNKWLFSSYSDMKNLIDDISNDEVCKNIWRKDNNVYNPLVWTLASTKKLKELNEVLINAYQDFIQYYTREEVEMMMSKLYRNIPLCLDEKIISSKEKIEIAYEQNIREWNGFKDYLEHICKNNFRYIDSSFVFNTLRLMNEKVYEDVYELLGNIVRRNNEGIALESINNLPLVVKERLFSLNKLEETTISIDPNFIVNYSKIKMLCYLLYSRLLKVDQVEQYRKDNNISMTQTYFNAIFSAMQKEHKSFNEMIDFLQENLAMSGEVRKNKDLVKSIQICISLIKSTKTLEQLEQIFTEYGFGEFRNRTEIIGAFIHRLHCLQNVKAEVVIEEAKKNILSSMEEVNIIVINEYLQMLLKVSLNEIGRNEQIKNKYNIPEIFNKCWLRLEEDGRIDINVLLENKSDDEWIIESNVQTYSFFVKQCPTIISYIWTRFNGNFYYIEDKSCLENLVKNYNKVYKVHCNHLGYYSSLKEVRKIAKILSSQEQEQVFKSLCQYIVNVRLSEFFKDLLRVAEFRQKFIDYIHSNEKLSGKYKVNGWLSTFISGLNLNNNNLL